MLQYTTMVKFYSYESNHPNERKTFLHTFQKVLEERLPTDLSVKIHNLKLNLNNRIVVALEGEIADDEVFVKNILKEITGETILSKNIHKGTILQGSFQSVGKVGFGVFVDCGIENPTKEVLIPLFRLRDQLVNGKKMPLSEIIQKYGFMDNLPVEIEITNIDYSKGGAPKFEGRFSDEFIEKLAYWIDDGLDIVFTTGAARQKIKKTLAKRGHTQDVFEVERLGVLETAIILQKGSFAPGIIARIGRFLSGCHLTTLQPIQVFQYWRN